MLTPGASTMPEDTWVLLARLVRPQGRKGEIIADIFTDFPERFASRPRVYLAAAEGSPARQTLAPREAIIERHWLHQGRIVFKFQGIDSINNAEPLRGLEVVIPASERAPLEDDAVYIGDLIGCCLIDLGEDDDHSEERVIGEITDVERGLLGAPDLLVIRSSAAPTNTAAPDPEAPSTGDRPRRGKRARKAVEILVPFAKKYLVAVDVQSKRVTMRLPDGLLELNTPSSAPDKAQEDPQDEA